MKISENTSVIDRIQSAYLIDVILTSNGKPKPKSNLELFRATGSINYFHGKQAEKEVWVFMEGLT